MNLSSLTILSNYFFAFLHSFDMIGKGRLHHLCHAFHEPEPLKYLEQPGEKSSLSNEYVPLHTVSETNVPSTVRPDTLLCRKL